MAASWPTPADLSPAYGKLWCTALKQRRNGQKEEALKALREGCRGFAAITDLPAILFVPELLELYPDLKVILVLRDPRSWWLSFGNILSYADAWYLPVMCSIAPGLRWVPTMVREWKIYVDQAMEKLGKKPGDYGPRRSLRSPSRPRVAECPRLLTTPPDIIEEYNESVRRAVPKDQLLEMRLGDGWEPLCRFLDKPIPNEPFPRVNEAETVAETNARTVRKLLFMWAGLFSVVGLAGYGVASLLKQ